MIKNRVAQLLMLLISVMSFAGCASSGVASTRNSQPLTCAADERMVCEGGAATRIKDNDQEEQFCSCKKLN